MGKGSSKNSDRPQFRTGNIVTPPKALATERKSVTVKMGRDDAPRDTLGMLTTMIRGAKVNAYGRTVWDSPVAGKISAVTAPEDAMTHAERDDVDRMAGVYRQRDGRVLRTTEMGDAPLPQAVQAAAERAATTRPTQTWAPKPQREARPVVDRDAGVREYLAALGHKGAITPQLRSLALDAIAFAQQVAAMGRD